MKFELQLKLQAYLDRELAAPEIGEVEELIQTDPAARDLLLELRHTQEALKGNEVAAKLPATREFFWSQIERRIQAEARIHERTSRRPTFFGWRQVLASFAGVAAVFTFIAVTSHRLPIPNGGPLADEVETVGDQEAVTFHNQAANMTVVWVQARPNSFTPTDIESTLPPE